ncbi:MAG: hypothetical protein AAGE52_06805 [Myxococcota bacterium]
MSRVRQYALELASLALFLLFVAAAAGLVLHLRRASCRRNNAIRTTQGELRAVTSAAMLYAVEHDGCPSLADLRGAYLDVHARVEDPWGRPYRVACHGERPVGASAGPDGVFGTEDDLTGE